jgi:shikimate dehydrogenase
MLLYQGIIAYELWFNMSIDESTANVARAALIKAASDKQNIVLVGYMGSGKTSIGKALAEANGFEFIDTDSMIEEKEGRSISDIFAAEGEGAFRDMETELLKELCTSKPVGAVISTGGGIVLRKENQELLKKLGRVVYLKASAETTFERVKGDSSRPLLAAHDEEALKAKIIDMLKVRGGYYELAADETVSTDGLGISEIAEKIR